MNLIQVLLLICSGMVFGVFLTALYYDNYVVKKLKDRLDTSPQELQKMLEYLGINADDEETGPKKGGIRKLARFIRRKIHG